MYCNRVAIFFFFFFFFYLCFKAIKIIAFILNRANRKVGRKREVPRKKKTTHDYPQAELGLAHVWPELGSNP